MRLRLRLRLHPVGCIAGTVGIAERTGCTAGSSGRHPGCMVGSLGSLGNPGSFGSSGSLDKLGSFGTPDTPGIPAAAAAAVDAWTAETSGISGIVCCLASDCYSTWLGGSWGRGETKILTQ